MQNCYNSFDAQPSSSSPIWKKNGNSNLSEYLNVWDSAKNEKEKKKSSEGVLSKTTLNLSREIEIYEQSVEDAENDSGVGKKVEEKALPPVEEPEIFPRQFENGVPETQIQQFTGSAKLFNPYTFGGPNAYALSPFISADGVHCKQNVIRTFWNAANRRSPKEVAEFVEKLGIRLKGGGKNKNSGGATILFWTGKQFALREKNSKSIISFVFLDEEIGNEQIELPVIHLQWDSGYLYLEYPDGDTELIKKLKISKNNNLVEVITNAKYAGNLSQVVQLKIKETSHLLDKTPSMDELFKFLTEYKFSSETRDSPTQSPSQKRAAPSDDFDFSVALNADSQAPSTQPKSKKLKLKGASSLEQETLMYLIGRVDTERKALPVPERRLISINDLISSDRIRTTSAESVEALLEKMEEGSFDFNNTTFIVLKTSTSKYIILDGNTRFKAQLKYNQKHALTQVKSVDCTIYADLNFDQIVMVTSSTYNTSTSFDHSILQTTKIVAKIMERHVIDAPAKKNEGEFTILMQCFLTNKYPVVVNQIIRLHPDILQQLFEMRCDNDVPLDQFKLSGVFWKTFMNAVKKNSVKSMELLSTLGENTKEEVEKALKKIETNLMEYLSEKSSHDFVSEADAIDQLTGGRKMSTVDFIKVLGEVGFNHNRTRSAKKFSWAGLTADIIKYLDEKEADKSLEFLSTVDDGRLAQQNIIIAQNPSIMVLQQLQKYHKQTVLFLIGAFNSPAPEIPNTKPTTTVDIIIQAPVLIDKISNYLPQSLVKTAVYIPGAPEGCQEGSNQFLTKVAMQKQCSLAAAMNLHECHSWFKLVEDYDKAMIYQCSYDVTKLLIEELTMFKSVTVVGDASLKELVDKKAEKPKTKEGEQHENNEENIADA